MCELLGDVPFYWVMSLLSNPEKADKAKSDGYMTDYEVFYRNSPLKHGVRAFMFILMTQVYIFLKICNGAKHKKSLTEDHNFPH